MAWCGPREDAGPAAWSAPLVEVPFVGNVAAAIGWGIICFVQRLRDWAKANPKKAYLTTLAAVVGCAILAPTVAHANFLDTIQQQFQDGTTGWMDNSIKVVGYGLFAALAVCTIMYQGAVYYAQTRTIHGLPLLLGVALLNLLIPWAIIHYAPDVLDKIPGTGSSIAESITGSPSATLSPSAIATKGATIGWTYLVLLNQAYANLAKDETKANVWESLKALPGTIEEAGVELFELAVALVLAAIIFIAFCMIAMELIMAYIQFYVTLPAAAWTLGFMGSPVTAAYSGAFWGAAIAQIVRFVVVGAVVVLASKIGDGWLAQVGSMQVPTFHDLQSDNGVQEAINLGLIKSQLSMLGGAVVLAIICRRVGDLADAALSGRATLGGAGIVSGVAAGAATAGAVIITGGMAGAAASGAALSGGASAGQAAMAGQMARQSAGAMAHQAAAGMRGLFSGRR